MADNQVVGPETAQIVQMLRKERQHHLERMRALDKAIAAYLGGSGVDIAPDEFAGRRLKVESIIAVLRKLNRPARIRELVPLLLEGGADLGKPERHERTLRTTARMNSKTEKHRLHYDPIAGLVGLREWGSLEQKKRG